MTPIRDYCDRDRVVDGVTGHDASREEGWKSRRYAALGVAADGHHTSS